MKILELDAGNSRIKWRIISTATGRHIQAHGVASVQAPATAVTGLAEQLSTQEMAEVDRIKIASVRGVVFAQEFTELAQDTWRLQPEFARVEMKAAGVSNAYTDVSTMGVDRWLAILAAYDKSTSACCVLDCGSATTFDWVDDSGRHRGGYIVPGLHLMRQSLAEKARALDIPLQDWNDPVPGTNTAAAIGNGILAMTCGFAEHCRDIVMANGGPEASWYLTGGDAEIVGSHLTWKHELARDLVMDGLALALP
jgi:type III pantothenate kinase